VGGIALGAIVAAEIAKLFPIMVHSVGSVAEQFGVDPSRYDILSRAPIWIVDVTLTVAFVAAVAGVFIYAKRR
jgi:hypothetical protein